VSEAGRILSLVRPLAKELKYDQFGFGGSDYSAYTNAWFDDREYRWDGKPLVLSKVSKAKCILVNARGFAAYNPRWSFYYTEDSQGCPMFYSQGEVLDLDDVIQGLGNRYPDTWGELVPYYVAHPNRRLQCQIEESRQTTNTQQGQGQSEEKKHVPKFGDSSYLLRRKRSQDKQETR